MKKLLTFMVLLAAVACNPYDIDEVLLQRNEISMTIKGEEQFSYDPLTCQMSHNSTTHEYRITDDRLADWLIVKCNDRPTHKDQELIVEVIWTASSSTKALKGLTFRVEKIDETGTVWMWCRKKSIGIVIKNL